MHDRDAVAARSPRPRRRRSITWPACRTSANRGATSTKRSPATCSPRITCSTRFAAPAIRRASSSRARRSSTRRRIAPSPKTMSIRPNSPYGTSKVAQEMVAKRAWEDDGIPSLIARAFNHIGPRQAPSFVASSIAKQIAEIEAGRKARQAVDGQSRIPARHHGRARHGARVSGDDAVGEARPSLQRLLGHAGADSRRWWS